MFKYMDNIYLGGVYMINNYNKIRSWEIGGIFWIIIVGSILHFTYDWSGKSIIVATFSPVNESVWEHLKLGYFALLLFIPIEYYFINRYASGYFLGKLIGILTMDLIIVIIFYLYKWITKSHSLFIDISAFVLGAIACQVISMKIIKLKLSNRLNYLGLIGFAVLGSIFVLFTFFTPEFPIFMDSNTKTYGIEVDQ